MTLATAKTRLALAKTDEEKQFWEDRIANKMKHSKYANLVVEEKSAPVVKKKKKVEKAVENAG